MSSDREPAISVRGLTKSYTITLDEDRPTNLAEAVARRVKNPFRRAPKQTFTALRDLSFDVARGEVVGVVGRNGAGKSTLLKVLSRITEPTAGEIKLYGRVGSLLEVGTGFHPELTGHENIFLNGAILGMTRGEIRREFDAIVEFAGVERFLDTPVKRYSSGMYVRLAFAVAAHLNPEILIVDEVLAVGDAEFQKKCLGKMQDVASSGRTVMFVSHNMGVVRELCQTAMLLNQGTLEMYDTAHNVIQEYGKRRGPVVDHTAVSPDGVRLEGIRMDCLKTQTRVGSCFVGDPYELTVSLSSENPITRAAVVVKVTNSIGELVGSLCSTEEGVDAFTLADTHHVRFRLDPLQLLPDTYRFSVFVYRPNDLKCYFSGEDVLTLDVEAAPVNGGMWAYQRKHGICRLSTSASVEREGVLV
ncbi:MAG: polysaccharide ABC transporter ATP-binding protein [Planctomycetota bacterium]